LFIIYFKNFFMKRLTNLINKMKYLLRILFKFCINIFYVNYYCIMIIVIIQSYMVNETYPTNR